MKTAVIDGPGAQLARARRRTRHRAAQARRAWFLAVLGAVLGTIGLLSPR